MKVILISFFISITYSLLILYSAWRTNLAAFCTAAPCSINRSHSQFKYDFKEQHVFLIETAILGVSLYLNLLLGILTTNGDSAYFISVTEHLANSPHPFAALYADGNITYPPFFHYLYYVLAQLLRLLHISFANTPEAFILAVKLPGILCEFLMAWMLYRFAKKHLKKGQTIPVLLLTLLNPAYLFVTAYICQIDALYVFFMLVTLLLIDQHRLKASYFAFAAAVLCKLQAVFITPIVFYAAINEVFFPKFNRRKFYIHLVCGLAAIFCMLLCYLPFVWNFSSGTFYNGGILIHFTSSVKSYGWASQNTYNFWNLAGYNFHQDKQPFGPFPCIVWGIVFIILLVFFSGCYFWYGKKDPCIYPMIGALLVSGTVCFSTRMMPRYLYGAIPLLIWGFIRKPSFRKLLCTAEFTVLFFLLNVFDYIIYPADDYTPKLLLPKIISIYFLACFAFLNYTILTESCRPPETTPLPRAIRR